MMLHPVIENLKKLRLGGIIEGLEAQYKNPEIHHLLFEERLAHLIDAELMLRDNNRLKKRLRQAKFRHQACIQDIIYDTSRKIDKSMIMSLEKCRWITEQRNVLITGATGTGKSYLAEALAHNACLKGFSVLRVQCPRIFYELTAAKADGSFLKLQGNLSKVDLLLFDDFGVAPLTDENRRDLLTIIDDRYKSHSTLVTSQLAVADWHEAIGDPILADAILDRLIHNSYRVPLEGESMRKKLSKTEGSHEKI
jgi:DNA replication protein DnaC